MISSSGDWRTIIMERNRWRKSPAGKAMTNIRICRFANGHLSFLIRPGASWKETCWKKSEQTSKAMQDRKKLPEGAASKSNVTEKSSRSNTNDTLSASSLKHQEHKLSMFAVFPSATPTSSRLAGRAVAGAAPVTGWSCRGLGGSVENFGSCVAGLRQPICCNLEAMTAA